MNRLAKAIRANENRITRFHTERGEFMPAKAWATVPQAVRDRLFPPAPRPWIALPAISRLERLLDRKACVFEFGSGYSTVWYAQRAGQVTALESNPEWHERVQELLSRFRIDNCDLRLLPLDGFVGELDAFDTSTLDLVSVDASESPGVTRLDYISAVRDRVKVGGVLVLDDSDRQRYRAADGLLAGWRKERFVGFRARPLMATETSLYHRVASE